MKFSVIIPAYNAEDHITPALESVKAQSFKDYELIVVCDSCTDRTEEIAQSYGAKTISINAHNDGVSRSAGLDIAQGDFVLFLDDDDWFMHEFVFQMLDWRTKIIKADVYCFGFIWKGVGPASPRSNGGSLYPSVWNKCWRRSFIGDTRFPDVYSVSDWFFHCDMMDKNPMLDLWDKEFVYYNYLRPGSISAEMGRTLPETKKYWDKN